VDRVLGALPPRLRPAMLSDILHETVVEQCRADPASRTRGLAAVLTARLRSDEFQHAVARLVRHEAVRGGRQVGWQWRREAVDSGYRVTGSMGPL